LVRTAESDPQRLVVLHRGTSQVTRTCEAGEPAAYRIPRRHVADAL